MNSGEKSVETTLIKRSVFVSHASKNFKIADEVRMLLEEQGISCWIAPRDIPLGGQYGTTIVEAIRDCTIVVLLLTDEANKSKPVENEIERAFNHQKTIVPIRLREIMPSKGLEFFVSNAQWVDAFYSPIKQRINEIANIVRAVETQQPIQAVSPERKTTLGKFERYLEQTLRHKFQLALAAFFVVAGLGVYSVSQISNLNSSITEEKRAIEEDPASIGLITLSDESPSDAPTDSAISLRAAIYLNVRGATFKDVKVMAVVESQAPGKSLINVSELLSASQGADVQSVVFLVPRSTNRVTMCITTLHPTLKLPVTAIWSYAVITGEHIAITRDRPPALHASNSNTCT